MNQRVFVAGDATWNTLIYLSSLPEPRSQTIFSRDHQETVGGTGAGKALNLAKLGVDSTFHCLLGDDQEGRRVRAFLDAEGVKVIEDLDPKGTERHVNLMADDGGRISIYVAYATFEPDLPISALTPRIAGADQVVLNIINYCRRLIPVAKQAARPVWTDLHDYNGVDTYHQDFVDGADFLFLSGDRLPDYRAFMARMIEAKKRLVVCTHGRRGATTLTAQGEWIETPILDAYPRVDTNGAGDAFFAGYLYGHLHGHSVERCLRIATIVSGLCISSKNLAFTALSPERLVAEYRLHYGEGL